MPDVKAYAVADAIALTGLAESNNLMELLGPGEYNLTLDATSTVTIPTLAAGSIVESSPRVGDTLTVSGSNEPSGGVAYQWQQSPDGSTGWENIGGATSATLDTSSGVSVDYHVRRGVEIPGVQSMVHTPGVQVAAAPVGITFVGANTQNIAVDRSQSPVDVSLPAGLQENDIVLCVFACDEGLSVGNEPPEAGRGTVDTSTWNTLQNNFGSAIPGSVIAWKRMGATPDSSIRLFPSEQKSAAAAIQAYRGVNTTTALDATPTVAFSPSGLPNPPSVTTVTDNALVVAIGCLDDRHGPLIAPSGYSNLTTADGGTDFDGASIGISSKIKTPAGAEDPGAYSHATVTNDGWGAMTIALRPA